MNCKAGEFTFFNLEDSSHSCKKCPPDTFSEGNDINIVSAEKDWNKTVLKDKMKFECYSINPVKRGDPTDGKNCTSFSVSSDGSYIQSGTTEVANNHYEGMISVFADTYEPTFLELTYDLKTIREPHFVNGGLAVVNNYEAIYSNFQSTGGKSSSF